MESIFNFKPVEAERYNFEFNKKHGLGSCVSVNEKNLETFECKGLAKALCTCPITFKPN